MPPTRVILRINRREPREHPYIVEKRPLPSYGGKTIFPPRYRQKAPSSMTQKEVLEVNSSWPAG